MFKIKIIPLEVNRRTIKNSVLLVEYDIPELLISGNCIISYRKHMNTLAAILIKGNITSVYLWDRNYIQWRLKRII